MGAGALRIGLTGGIACGKSAAADAFARLGVTVIDTDRIARELVEPGQPALADIVALFGKDIVDAGGTLDRPRLRKRIFADAHDRRRLEAILHPAIRRVAIERAERCTSAYCILVIPLLAQHRDEYPLDRILVIDCPEPVQRERLARRDALSAGDIEAALAAQASRAARLSLADDIIRNDGDMQHLAEEVRQLHARYLAIAAAREA